MATLLSEYLEIDSEEFSKEGVFDAVIGVDTKLFIDPSLLIGIEINEFTKSREKLVSYFSKIITLLQFGENERIKKQQLKC